MEVVMDEEITVKELKEAIAKKSGLTVDEQQLVFGGKQLENDKELTAYPPLQSMSTIFLVMRLPGGASDSTFLEGIPQFQENCSVCYDTPSLKMPCSHFYCPTCIVRYSWNEANSRAKTEIKCFKCGTEWDLHIIQHYGCLSKQQIGSLANKLSDNFIRGNGEIRDCPGCGNFCQRQDKTKTRVYCRQCTKEKREAEYCFYCSESWKNPLSYTECGNPNCNPNAILDTIQRAPSKIVIGVECPSLRLCPTCGAMIEHKDKCKHITCLFCSTDFCFICLRTKVNKLWQCGAYNTKCTPAPVQTVIPQK